MHNQLVRDGIDVISEETDFVHVSGHPNRDELEDMYTWIKPNSIIPVHGEQRHMLEHINFAKEMNIPYPVKVENGDIVRIYPGSSPEVYDKAPYGKVYLDGTIGVEEDAKSIKERRNLSIHGQLYINIIITKEGKLQGRPIINMMGLPILNYDELKSILYEEIENISKSFSLKNKKQEDNYLESIKNSSRKIVKEKTGKKPITNINLVRI